MIKINIDKKTQQQATKVLETLGLDFNSGIKMFLEDIIKNKKMPFQERTDNGFTPEQEDEMLKEAEWAMKHGKSYKTIEEAHRDILGHDYK